ncbi:MAG TPA: hypothetical protein PKK68_04875 [Methanothrix soehngenii]|jgi:hypothetical protein|nr:hypothetical protein [Methanothrix soehngenii]
MNKIWSGLGLAVLGIAILVGAAAAEDSASKSAPVSATVNDVTMSFSTSPSGATLGTYVKAVGINGVPAVNSDTKTDTIGITSNAPWSLTIEDSNIATSSNDGKMRQYASDNYVSPEVALTNGFNVGITGGNSYDLSATGGRITIQVGQSAGSAIPRDITYSQGFASTDTAGTYRIDLTYSIAYST